MIFFIFIKIYIPLNMLYIEFVLKCYENLFPPFGISLVSFCVKVKFIDQQVKLSPPNIL